MGNVNSELYFGSSSSGNWLHGSLDNFLVIDKVVNSIERLGMWNLGKGTEDCSAIFVFTSSSSSSSSSIDSSSSSSLNYLESSQSESSSSSFNYSDSSSGSLNYSESESSSSSLNYSDSSSCSLNYSESESSSSSLNYSDSSSSSLNYSDSSSSSLNYSDSSSSSLNYSDSPDSSESIGNTSSSSSSSSTEGYSESSDSSLGFFPASDGFSGTGYDSGSLTDANFLRRFADANEGVRTWISSTGPKLTCLSTQPTARIRSLIPSTGDFTVNADVVFVSFTGSDRLGGIEIMSETNAYYVGYYQGSFNYFDGSSWNYLSPAVKGSYIILSISRTGSTMTFTADGTSAQITMSDDITNVGIIATRTSTSSQTIQMTCRDIEVLDGEDYPIPIFVVDSSSDSSSSSLNYSESSSSSLN
jgi:hypothetical protein